MFNTMNNELKPLIDKLDPVCRRALEMASALCVVETHFTIEIEHLLLELLDHPGTGIVPVLRHHGIDDAKVARELTGALRNFDRGNTRNAALSPLTGHLLRKAWMESRLTFGSTSIAPGAILVALCDDDALGARIRESSPTLGQLRQESLRETIGDVLGDWNETRMTR